ncbi:hypothetical protein ACQY74_001516 (plasmid) [Rhizobium leguminosarum bv. trifolii]
MQQFKGLQRPLRVFSDTQRCRSEIAGTDEVGSKRGIDRNIQQG